MEKPRKGERERVGRRGVNMSGCRSWKREGYRKIEIEREEETGTVRKRKGEGKKKRERNIK